MRRLLIVSALLLAGCGGSSSPTAPTPPVATTVSISGRILTTLTDAPVVGATVTVGGKSTGTAADGSWQIDGLTRSATLDAEVSAGGYLTHHTKVRTDAGRSNIEIDLIRDAAPFNLAFFREIARNGRDSPSSLDMTRQITFRPSVYVDTRTPTGNLTEAEITALRESAAYSIGAASGGTLSLDRFESGAESRAPASNWINVSFEAQASTVCATALVGANPGQIIFNTSGACAPECSGFRFAIDTARHEFGHTVGLRHVAFGLMGVRTPGPCASPSRFTDAELYHARVAYARERGNLDIDRDAATVVR